MQTTVEINGKYLDVSTTREADAVLSQRALPLNVEMELYFSCLLCKKVRFHVERPATPPDDSLVHINNKLSVSFHPVMLKQCGKAEVEQRPIMDFPIVNKQPYTPKWLYIDFRFGHWYGEFGYIN